MVTLKELARKDDLFTSGHKLCPGCGIPIILKLVLRATKHPIVVANATGCLEAASTHFPRTSWKTNWIHSGAGNAAATMSGIEVMYKSLKKQGRLSNDKEVKFLVIGGDGGTYDIGFGALSGALERGHNFVYLCIDNQSYACSGGQRSSASPMGASTATTPAGKILPGKLQYRKDIAMIAASHKISYVAQSAPWRWQDLYKKAARAFEMEGVRFLNILSPCPTEWKFPTHKSVELTRLAVDTCVWPIYEVERGSGPRVSINYRPQKKLPVTEWFKAQDRFKHLLRKENKWILEEIQDEIDNDWEQLCSQEKENRDRVN